MAAYVYIGMGGSSVVCDRRLYPTGGVCETCRLDESSVITVQQQFAKICHRGGICKPSARLLLELLNDPGHIGCRGNEGAIGNGALFVQLN